MAEKLVNKSSKYIRVTSSIKDLANFFEKKVGKVLLLVGEYLNIYKKRDLYKKIHLSKNQKKEISNFFKENYGKNFSNKWHRLYQSYTGCYHYNYFPEILYTTKVETEFNKSKYADVFEDKNLLTTFFGTVENIHIPKTYLACINGVFRDEFGSLRPLTEILPNINNLGKCVIKKTVDSCSGRDVLFANIVDGVDIAHNLKLRDLLLLFGDNFVIQEKVKQHESFAKLNPSSLNTLRVITYICENRVFIAPVCMRIGRNGNNRDNLHDGGIGVGVDEEGYLQEYALGEFGEKFYEHPDSKIAFKKYKLPEFDKIVLTAKQLHEKMPYLKILSWDLSLDDEGRTVLIEMNVRRQGVWFIQGFSGKPLFGENTAKILKMIGKN